MADSIIARIWNGFTIGQRKADGFVNATALCKAHNNATKEDKRINDWLSSARTCKTLYHLAVKLGLAKDDSSNKSNAEISALAQQQAFWGLVVVVKGGVSAGTWIHPKLAVRFAIWLSDDFGFLVEEWVEEWLTTGKNPVATYQARQDIIRSLIPSKPFTWQKRYKDEFWEHLHRLAKYKQGNPQCAKFINRHIYGYFDKDVRDRLDEVNPLIDGRRKNKQHQHFDGDLLTALQTHIIEVIAIMESNISLTDFENAMDAKFKKIYHLKIPGF